MEEQQRNEVLSKLYALRAGISTVSLEKNKADGISQNYENTKKKLDECKESLISAKTEVNTQLNTVNNNIKKLEIDLKEEKDYHSRILKRLSCPSSNFFRSDNVKVLLIYIGIIICVIGFILGFTFFGISGQSNGIALTIGSVSFAMGGGLIYLRVKNGEGFCNHNSEDRSSLNYATNEIKRIEKELSLNKNRADELKKQIAEADAGMETYYEGVQLLEENLKDNEEDIIKHVESGNVIYAALKSEYNSLIDERDWENLDYVIYAVETGRADTMKEALQLLDRERQTDRIVTAVTDASKAISDSFGEGFYKLGSLMVKCCEVLTLKADEVCQQMIIQREEQNEHLSDMRKYISNLTDEVSLGNALQEKSNETSLQIIEDVRTMKNNSNYADTLLHRSEYKFN